MIWVPLYLPGNILRRKGPPCPLSLEELEWYLAGLVSGPRSSLELLGKVGHPGPQEAVQAGGGGPDVRVVDGVTVDILVTHRAHAVTALQLVGKLACRPEYVFIISFLSFNTFLTCERELGEIWRAGTLQPARAPQLTQRYATSRSFSWLYLISYIQLQHWGFFYIWQFSSLLYFYLFVCDSQLRTIWDSFLSQSSSVKLWH